MLFVRMVLYEGSICWCGLIGLLCVGLVVVLCDWLGGCMVCVKVYDDVM